MDGLGGPKLGWVGGGLGRVLSSGGKLWLGEGLMSVQPVNRSPLLLALTGSTRSGGTTVEPTPAETPLPKVNYDKSLYLRVPPVLSITVSEPLDPMEYSNSNLDSPKI